MAREGVRNAGDGKGRPPWRPPLPAPQGPSYRTADLSDERRNVTASQPRRVPASRRQNCSAHESILPTSWAALSPTRSFQVPLATSDDAFTVYVVITLSALPPVPYALRL